MVLKGRRTVKKENGCVSIEIICGISSVVYFMSQISLSWDDAKITSAHGKNCNLVSMIKQNQKVFFHSGNRKCSCGTCTEAGGI